MDGSFPFPRGRQVDRRMPAAPLPLGWITAAASARKGVAGLDISLAQAGPAPLESWGVSWRERPLPRNPIPKMLLSLNQVSRWADGTCARTAGERAAW